MVSELERSEWLAWYSSRELATVPVVARGKRPLRAGWQRGDPDAWREAPADVNVGILCGAASGGLVVLDFDTRDGVLEVSGMRPEALAVHTLVARTARGWHVYARDELARTSSPWKGLDVRAEGSMVVAPPSVHASGARYEFVDADVPIASLASLPFVLEPDAPMDTSVVEVDWSALEELISAQAPKLRAHWALLKDPAREFDRSRADFVVARCLWEAGYGIDAIVSVLRALPGSKAIERGEAYARRTAAQASRARR